MDQQKRATLKRTEWLKRLDFFTASRSKRRVALKKKWNVGAERSSDVVQCFCSKHSIKNLVQGEQRRDRITTAAAKSRGHWNFLFEKNSCSASDSTSLKKSCRRAMHQVAGVCRQRWI